MHSIYANYQPKFLYVNRYIFPESWTFPESVIYYCMYRYIVSGSAVFMIDGKKYVVHAGDIAYIPQGCRMMCMALAPIEFISIRFVGSIQLNGTDILGDYLRIPKVTPGNEEMFALFRRTHEAAVRQDSLKMFEIRGCLNLITYFLAHHAEPVSAPALPEATISDAAARTGQAVQDSRIDSLVDYLTTHANENFDCAMLSKMIHMSESSLRRLFKRYTGKTPTEFLHELRMTTAARQLLVSDDRISTIAYALGFETPNYFSRMFRQTFGVSPKEYRKHAQDL